MQSIAGLKCNGARRHLFVLLHAFCQSPQTLKPVQDAIRDTYPDADIYAPKLPFAGKFGWTCLRDASAVAADLVEVIDGIVQHRELNGQQYESINLVGHSIGAVFARKIAIVAHAEQQRAGEDAALYAPFEKHLAKFRAAPLSWASRIRRIILIAGMNRGWSPSSAMDWVTSIKWSASTWFGELFLFGSPVIFGVRQGAVFSVQTRLQWLALMHRKSTADRPNIVVTQLLGTVDDIVAPDDSVDYAVDSSDEDSAKSYFYLEVPNSGHHDIIDLRRPNDIDAAMAAPEGPSDPTPTDLKQWYGEQRYVVFRHALCDSVQQLAASPYTVTRDQMNDSLPNAPEWGVTDVVFVIHGIRDKGFWTQKVARAIKEEATLETRDFRSVTTSYGYFAMAPFVLWWIRKQKAEWLMDQYAETRARYPRAVFSYVGHSNGTYLVARALRDYPAANFKRIVLAGSVVRRDYKWRKLVAEQRVGEVLNYVATGDWVVALFPKGMQPMPIFDLGSAGHDGFKEASAAGPVHQVSYIVGSHSAGHEERHWADIAKFIVSGSVPLRDTREQSTKIRWLGRCSTGLLILLVVTVLVPGLLFAWPAFWPKISPKWAAGSIFAATMYFWLVYIVVSRV